jgi:hypothetical protein
MRVILAVLMGCLLASAALAAPVARTVFLDKFGYPT